MVLHEEFLRLCRDLSQQENALHTEIKEEKRVTCFSMFYRACRVELVYSRKWENVAPPSVLYARIYLNKNDPMYLHLPELISYLNEDDYRACYFPYIESVQRMRDCFAALVEILHYYIPKAEHLGFTGEDRAIMCRWATEGFPDQGKEDPEALSKDEIDWETMILIRRYWEMFIVSRYTNFDAYLAFLSGDREKAIQQYCKLEKDGGLLPYEIGLLRFLQSDASQNFEPILPQCFCAPEYKKGENGDRTDIKGILILYGIISGILCGTLAIINAVLAHGTIYFCGSPWWMGFLLALLPAAFGYFAFRRSLRQKLGGSVAFQDIQKSEKFAQRFAGVAFVLVVIGCIWFCVSVPPMSSRYYDNYAVYYTENEQIARFEYTQVVEVCHIQSRYNVYGERVERDSYVLILENGNQFDMDSDASAARQLEMINRLFPGIEIRELDSDRDLPGFSE